MGGMRQGRLWVLPLLGALLLMGCTPTQNQAAGEAARLAAQNQELQDRVKALEVEVAELKADGARVRQELTVAREQVDTLFRRFQATQRQLNAVQEQQAVNLIYPRYLMAPGDERHWGYHRAVTADLDRDGSPETVHVRARAPRDAEETGWDDGHPWNVYVEEPDGTRTYIYAGWVQIGRLDVMLTEGQQIVILNRQGAGLAVYRVQYRGPEDYQAAQMVALPILNWALPVLPGRE